MRKSLVFLLFGFCPVTVCADKDTQEEFRSIGMRENVTILAPSKLTVTGPSFLKNVVIDNRFFAGAKDLDFPTAGLPTNVLSIVFNPASGKTSACVELHYFANVIKNLVPKKFFCSMKILLSSNVLLAVLDAQAYVDGDVDVLANITTFFDGTNLTLIVHNYTPTDGVLCFSVWGENVEGVS